MKIIHIPFGYAPDPVGGTEVYVHALAKKLDEMGISVTVAAPGRKDDFYQIEGIRVYRFQVPNRVSDLADLYGRGSREAAASFGRILDNELPDIVHLHAFTSGASILTVHEAKLRGISVIFTYHTPTVSCQRGTLLHWGEEVCDGRLDVRRCTSCSLHGLGINRPTSQLLGLLPTFVGRAVSHTGLSGRTLTALRMSELVALRQSSFRQLMDLVDHIVVLSKWTGDLLQLNGVPSHKMTTLPQGLDLTDSTPEAVSTAAATRPQLRVAFLGRFDPTKGPDVLIRAVRDRRELPIALHLFGIVQEGAEKFAQSLRTLAGNDPRIEFRAPVPRNQIISCLKEYDILAVPSQCLETGPLVVLEAFAAGVPVVGSNLGGIAEVVHHGVDGLLVDPSSPGDWAEVLRKLANDRALLKRLKKGVKPPRRMRAVADDMLEVYRKVIGTDRFSVHSVELRQRQASP